MDQQVSISNSIRAQFGRQVEFLQHLIRAKSANPYTPETSPPDVPVEEEVAAVIHQELHHLGFPSELHGISPQRPNVVCYLPGMDKRAKTLIVTTHTDTVEPSGYTRDPWGAEVEEGRLYGVGAADAKAQIAAFLYAAHALRTADIAVAGHLTLAFVVDEESGACSQYGTRYLLDQGWLDGDGVIVGEPGNTQVTTAHRGLYRFRLQIQGEATHTGMQAWEQGTRGHNAILDMARVTVALAEVSLPGASTTAFPRRRSMLTFPTLIKGGSGINVVPASCEAYGDARLLPGISAHEVREVIEEQLKRLSITAYRLDDLVSVPAAETAQDAEIVQTLARAAETITGRRPPLQGCGPACDGWMFITRGIPTVCGYGVTGGGAHGADEWVDLESLRSITEIYAHAMVHFLGSR